MGTVIALILKYAVMFGGILGDIGPYMKNFFKWIRKPSPTPRYIRWIIVLVLVLAGAYLFFFRAGSEHLRRASLFATQVDSLYIEIDSLNAQKIRQMDTLQVEIAGLETLLRKRPVVRQRIINEDVNLRTRIDRINAGLARYSARTDTL